MTLIVPLLALLTIGVFHVAAEKQKSAAVKEVSIGYVDEEGGFYQYTNQGSINLVRFDKVEDAVKVLNKGGINEYFVIPPDYLSHGVVRQYSLQKRLSVPKQTVNAITNFLISNILSGNVSRAALERVKSPLNLLNITIDENGNAISEQAEMGNFVILGVFSVLFALSMIFSSTYMLQSLGGEKENRLMEILLSSVSARQLLTGKILGLGAAGLVQVGVWAASLPFLYKLASSAIEGLPGIIHLPTSFLVLGVVYFILGYLLFAVLSAGVGAISPTTEEGQQLSSIYTLFALVPIWLMSLVILFPDSPVWTIFTIFPFSAPVLVMVRLGVSSVAPWEIAVSISVLILTIIGAMLLSAKIFNSYLLMYGKKPGLKEIVHSIETAKM